MIGIGALLAGVAVGAALVGSRGGSAVARRLAVVAPAGQLARRRWAITSEIDLRHAGLAMAPDHFMAIRIASAATAALIAAVATLVAPVGPAIVALAAGLGFLFPAMVVDRRAAASRSRAEREIAVLVERLEALVAAGRPPESALAILLRRRTRAMLLDQVLRRTADAYDLGAPIFRTLAAHARAEGLVTCATAADELERARDLGIGSLSVIRERRGSLRAAQRALSLAGAAQVEGKLMLVLVLCYLPALMLLVVIPLLIGLLDGLFG